MDTCNIAIYIDIRNRSGRRKAKGYEALQEFYYIEDVCD